MEDQTCMEYLFRCVQNNHLKNINQNILFNASNEFRNLWNLVKKLRDLARVDVQKITRFLDAVQEALEKKTWSEVTRQYMQAENEYKQIRRYIRPSFLEDFKVVRFIENVDQSVKSKSGTKREKKPPTLSGNQHRRQNFRNQQINKQNKTNETEPAVIKINDQAKKDATHQKEADNQGRSVKTSYKENRSLASDQTKIKEIENEKSPEKQTESESDSQCVVKAKQSGTHDSKDRLSEEGEMKNCVMHEKYYKGSVESGEKSDKMKSMTDENNDYDNEKVLSTKATEGRSDENITKEREKLESTVRKNVPDETKTGDNNLTLKATAQSSDQTKKHFDNPLATDNDGQTLPSTSQTDAQNEIHLDGQLARDSDGGTLLDSAQGDAQNKSGLGDLHAPDNDEQTLLDTTQNEAHNTDHLDDLRSTDKQRNLRKVPVNVKPKDISSLVSERMTGVSIECNVDEILTELGTIYEMDWSIAYKALTGCLPSNGMKNTIDFLGEILKVAAQKVKNIPEKDLSLLKKDKVPSSVTDSLRKLKKEFLRRHLKELQAEHSIEYADATDGEYSVNIYSAKCVELAWFMLTRQPPMVFDYDSRPMLLEDLYEIFKPYKNRGNCIHYVVWPAIRRCLGGEVVSLGIADFR